MDKIIDAIGKICWMIAMRPKNNEKKEDKPLLGYEYIFIIIFGILSLLAFVLYFKFNIDKALYFLICLFIVTISSGLLANILSKIYTKIIIKKLKKDNKINEVE
jgi:hypothetical protein